MNKQLSEQKLSDSKPKDFKSKNNDFEDFEIRVSKKSVWLVRLTFLSLIIFFIWAYFTEIDQAVRGMGQVVPSQRVQLIQNLEGGIVQNIFVKEGQRVEQGEIVMQIDNEAAGSQYRENLIRSLEHEASIARLEALISDSKPIYSDAVLAVPELVKRQNDMLSAARIKQKSEFEVLNLQSESKRREAAELSEKKKQLQASLKLIEKQRELALTALRAKAYSELDFLNIEQEIQSINAELASMDHSIPRLESEARQAEERQNLHRAELESEAREELNLIQIQLLALKELLTAGDDRVRRTEMRSPVNGIVKTIFANTLGGVVTPGETVMEIVPLDDSLIIEAKFSPADIAFIYPGQRAKVRLTAYDFSIYGGMDAVVETISADTLENQQGDIFYQVKIKTNSSFLEHDQKKLPILAGMMSEIDIITGKRSILNYILKPLLKTQQRAFRER